MSVTADEGTNHIKKPTTYQYTVVSVISSPATHGTSEEGCHSCEKPQFAISFERAAPSTDELSKILEHFER